MAQWGQRGGHILRDCLLLFRDLRNDVPQPLPLGVQCTYIPHQLTLHLPPDRQLSYSPQFSKLVTLGTALNTAPSFLFPALSVAIVCVRYPIQESMIEPKRFETAARGALMTAWWACPCYGAGFIMT